MIQVGILSFRNGFRRGMQDFYPLFKWRKSLKKAGLEFSFFSDHTDEGLFNHDVVIINHRYLRRNILHGGPYESNEFIIPTIEKLKKRNCKVVLYDFSASSGCKYFDLIDHVDLVVKRQLLKDRSLYCQSPHKTIKPYLWDYNLSEIEKEKYKAEFSCFKSCSKENLDKLEFGWNTGMVDYRYFPLKRYYPVSTERLLNRVYRMPSFERPDKQKRTVGTVFRGQLREGKKMFSFQRNQLIKILDEMNSKYGCHTGSKVPLNQYANELKISKVCFSPFGWGEICYRDFEAALYGCVLIKPSMNHIDTYPDIFHDHETYIPVKWNMSDAKDVLIDTIEHYEERKKTAFNLQKSFESQISSDEYIVGKMLKICRV